MNPASTYLCVDARVGRGRASEDAGPKTFSLRNGTDDPVFEKQDCVTV